MQNLFLLPSNGRGGTKKGGKKRVSRECAFTFAHSRRTKRKRLTKEKKEKGRFYHYLGDRAITRGGKKPEKMRALHRQPAYKPGPRRKLLRGGKERKNQKKKKKKREKRKKRRRRKREELFSFLQFGTRGNWGKEKGRKKKQWGEKKKKKKKRKPRDYPLFQAASSGDRPSHHEGRGKRRKKKGSGKKKKEKEGKGERANPPRTLSMLIPSAFVIEIQKKEEEEGGGKKGSSKRGKGEREGGGGKHGCALFRFYRCHYSPTGEKEKKGKKKNFPEKKKKKK